MNKSMLAVAGLAAAMIALPAAAQMRSPSLSSAYIGATIGQSEFKFDCGVGESCDTKDTAWRILAGYQFNRNLAAEIGYHNFGAAKFTGPGFDEKVEGSAWELVGIGAFPLGNAFAVYGKLGGYYGKFEGGGASDTNTGLTFGIGGQFDVARNIGLRLEWQRYNDMGENDAKADVDVMSFGIVYRFQ
jgi:OmpA-OmpF porin, OOP family